MPEISVIVPVYNAEAYLRPCVDSILAQTFTDFELILVDDGSPDGSGRICDAYAARDPRVRVIHQENGGVSAARNAGLDAARGTWIVFVDSDDYVADSYLRDLSEPEYDLTAIGYTDVFEKKGYRKAVPLAPYRAERFDGGVLAELMERGGKTWMSFVWGHLFRRDIIERHAVRFSTEYALTEDTLFVAEYLTHCGSVCVKDSVSYIYVHRHSGSLSTSVSGKFFEDMVRTDEKLAHIMQNAFGVPFPRKIRGGIPAAQVWYMGIVVCNDAFSFRQQYQIYRFIFRSPYFKEALADPERYFPGTSPLYRFMLNLRSPLLTLSLLTLAKKSSRGRKKQSERKEITQ